MVPKFGILFRSNCFRIILLEAIAVGLSTQCYCDVVYVDWMAPFGGDGSSWGTAKRTIQEGIDTAISGDQVWVAAGFYSGGMVIKSGVEVYGGFDKTESSPEDRNLIGNVSNVAGSGYHVVEMDTVSNTRLDGFWITDGNADGAGLYEQRGGGIFCIQSGSSNIITNCRIEGNSSVEMGGGMYVGATAGPVVTGCTFSNNSSQYGGGMKDAYNSSTQITRCVFCNNSAQTGGGYDGPANLGYQEVLMVNCLFVGNTASDEGGAISLLADSFRVANCTFYANSAPQGGAIYNNMSSPTIESCVFVGNTGYAFFDDHTDYDPSVRNCLFYQNPDGDWFDRDASPQVRNGALEINALPEAYACVTADPRFVPAPSGTWTDSPLLSIFPPGTTLTDTSASFSPGSLVGLLINPRTSGDSLASIIANTTNTITVTGMWLSIVPGDSYEVLDFHLTECSGAIDRGWTTPSPWIDLDGNPRPVAVYGIGGQTGSTTFDIGAFEYQVSSTVSCIFEVPADYPTIQGAITAACEPSQVVVSPGIYDENIHILGKEIVVRSTDPEDRATVHATVIDGGARNSVVTFAGTENSNTRLMGLTIRNGLANGGGGVDGNGTTGRIEGNYIRSNTAYSSGGGIVDCDGRVVNNVIYGNAASTGGGVASCNGSIVNNTIYSNQGDMPGMGIYASWASISNNIIWDNWSVFGDTEQLELTSSPDYCCIQYWTGPGTGNITADPRLVAPHGAADFHLQSDSPCIDAGEDGSVFTVTEDFEGDARGINAVSEPRGDGSDYDIGADEFYVYVSPTATPTPTLTPWQPRTSVGNWAIYR